MYSNKAGHETQAGSKALTTYTHFSSHVPGGLSTATGTQVCLIKVAQFCTCAAVFVCKLCMYEVLALGAGCRLHRGGGTLGRC